MRDIFEVGPEVPTDEFDGVDLLYGLSGDPRGKCLTFFKQLARERGIDVQQDFARFASTQVYPCVVEDYAERLVLKLSLRAPNRNSTAWQMAGDEIARCREYLEIVAAEWVIPVAVSKQEDGCEQLAWEMVTLGEHHLRIDELLKELESYKDFCIDPNALGDSLQTRIELMCLNEQQED
jgi:hypothetical protein